QALWSPRVDRQLYGVFWRDAWSSMGLHNSKGWPQNSRNYAPCLLLFLTVYRSIRSSEVLSANGYVLPAYAAQRTIKDQLIMLCAAANGLASCDQLFGRDGIEGQNWNEGQRATVIKNRQKSIVRSNKR